MNRHHHGSVSDDITSSFGKYRDLFVKSRAIMLIIDPEDGRIVNANAAALEFYGYSRTEIQEQYIYNINTLSRNDIAAEMRAARNDERNYFNFKHRNRDGEICEVEVYSTPFIDVGHKYLFSIVHDISARYKLIKDLEYQANHDILTTLPNRYWMNRHIRQIIERARFKDGLFAVIVLDIDNLKEINDLYDHRIGDMVIRQLAERLQRNMTDLDVLGSQGGDHFVIVRDIHTDVEELIPFIESLVELLGRSFLVEDKLIKASCSAGITVYPFSGMEVNELLRNANIALHRAKKDNPGSYVFFKREMHERIIKQTILEAELHQALENNEFQLYYQPVIDIRYGRIAGFEALIRWLHPERGFIEPARFIPVAERNQMIIMIGNWVFMKACKQLRELEGLPGLDMRLSVNISTRHFQNRNIIRQASDIITQSCIDPARVTIEITESAMIDDMQQSIEVLTELHSLGVRIAIDDFGTGYSSLQYLATLPFDIIKIDRSFVKNLPKDRRAASLIRSIHGLAEGLDKEVIVEGVETAAQLNWLFKEGLHQIQGYFFARPLDFQGLQSYIQNFDPQASIAASIPDWSSLLS
ncbi:MAG: GGDEF domain-containing protein [Leptospiraceae bacterium]|nr:GGDEF domain-containing protein [Leptospiraceae bacterium]